MTTVTANEIIEAIHAATRKTADPTGAATADEIAAAMGIGVKTVRQRLAAVKATGRLEVVTVAREWLDGRMGRVPAYRITKGKKP